MEKGSKGFLKGKGFQGYPLGEKDGLACSVPLGVVIRRIDLGVEQGSHWLFLHRNPNLTQESMSGPVRYPQFPLKSAS